MPTDNESATPKTAPPKPTPTPKTAAKPAPNVAALEARLAALEQDVKTMADANKTLASDHEELRQRYQRRFPTDGRPNCPKCGKLVTVVGTSTCPSCSTALGFKTRG